MLCIEMDTVCTYKISDLSKKHPHIQASRRLLPLCDHIHYIVECILSHDSVAQ